MNDPRSRDQSAVRPEWTDPDTSDASPAPTSAVDRPDPAVPAAFDAVTFRGRTPNNRLRVGLIAGTAMALVVGAAATSLAASPGVGTSAAPGSSAALGATQAPATTQAPANGSAPDDHGPGLGGFMGGRDGFGRFDGGAMRGMHGLRNITIVSISGSDLALRTADGWSRTITVSSTTVLTKGGQTISASDLKAGDQVRFSQTLNADGSYTVTAVNVVVPSVAGVVSGLSGSDFRVTTRDGSIWTIATDGSTTYLYGTGSGTASDVKDGTTVLVQGTSSGDNSLAATSVTVRGQRSVGTVTAKTGNSITITTRDGSSLTVHVNSSTTYRIGTNATASLSDVTVGMVLGAEGRARADGSIDAATVVDGSAVKGGPGFFGGRGGHKFGGFGPGMMDPDGSDGTSPNATPAPSSSAG